MKNEKGIYQERNLPEIKHPASKPTKSGTKSKKQTKNLFNFENCFISRRSIAPVALDQL